MIAVNVISDDDPEIVRAQSLPGQLSFLRMRQGGKPQPVSIEEALAHEFTPLEEEFIAARNARQAVGTPDEVETRLRSLLAVDRRRRADDRVRCRDTGCAHPVAADRRRPARGVPDAGLNGC